MSRRFHVILSDGQYELLDELANRMRISIGELIRTVIDRELRPEARPPKNGITLSLGLTRRPGEPFVGRRPGVKFTD